MRLFMGSKNKETEGTRLDLGDDLLEKTSVTGMPAMPSAAMDAEDSFASAEILLGEGLVEEAKKILRKILRVEPDHLLLLKH